MIEDEGNGFLRDPLRASVVSSLKFGAACGTAGFLIGGTVGVLRQTTPFLFACVSGLQTTALGVTFEVTRSMILDTWTPSTTAVSSVGKSFSPWDLTKASTLAGTISGGTIAAITRGRANIIPGMIMWSIFGGAGQMAYNRITMRPETPKEPLLTRVAKSGWSPVKVMSDEEYADTLRERVLRLDAEVAILNDRIATLRKQQDGTTSNQKDESG